MTHHGGAPISITYQSWGARLGVVDFVLMRRYARKEIPAAAADAGLPIPAIQY
jgi:hypothetical protein